MQYRTLAKNGTPVSLLGYGCMRFPSKGGSINREETFQQLKYAFDQGVNYFDTAYPYHAGKSEVILGEFIKQYDLRDQILIADKLPTFLITKGEQIAKFFATQLSRLDTDYIDYYLMHMLTSFADWAQLKELGIRSFLDEKKASGAIRHIGFSFHGRPEEFIKILEDYPWEFCQIQYNYLDINHQAGLTGLKRAHELGMGVVIMEPLRGGALAAKAPDRVKEILLEDTEQLSPAYWGLRFVMNHAEVSVVLSGMNNMGHIKENLEVAERTLPLSLSDHQLDIIGEIRGVYGDLMQVPCTGCNYCMPCPFGVDIPATFSDYNSKYFFQDALFVRAQYVARSAGVLGGKKSGANLCVACGKCKTHCPQTIDIPVKLQEAHKELTFPFAIGMLSFFGRFLKK